MTHRATYAALGLAAAALTACGVPVEETSPTTQAAQPIVNGQVANGDPAVVALIGDGNFVCTGTLIRPSVVLTAAHCVPPHISEFGVTSYGQMAVFFGTNLGGNGEYRQVVDGWTHPGWNEEVFEHDIALLRLQSAGPATPIPFNEQALGTIDQGAQIRILGFGMTGAEQFNTIGPKREALTTIAEVYPFVFTLHSAPGITCNGDSGGTTLMMRQGQEVVVGVHSRSDCEANAVDTRVDEYADLVYDFLGETPGSEPQCHADGQCATSCTTPDPDCPCAGDGFCGAECPDQTTDPDCDQSCGADGVCDESCLSDPDCGIAPPTETEDGWAAGNVGEKDYDAVEPSGCSTGPSPSEPRSSAAWWALLGLGVWVTRRRR